MCCRRSYNICEPRRLKRVAKRLEQSAVRMQKSVFIFVGSRAALDGVTGGLTGLIDVAEDRLQTWPLHDCPEILGWNTGTALPGHVAAVAFMAADGRRLLARITPEDDPRVFGRVMQHRVLADPELRAGLARPIVVEIA